MSSLRPLDAAFVRLETVRAPVYIASVAILAGPMPARSALRLRLDARSRRLPRLRQRLVEAPGRIGGPRWVDDADFSIDEHVSWAALPSPGGDHELNQLVGMIMSVPLAKEHPQWEAWAVEGLPDGRWAMITKLHHSMTDGIGGMDLLTAMMDDEHVPHAAHRPVVVRSERAAPPMPAHRMAGGMRGLVTGSWRRLRGAGDATRGFVHFAELAVPPADAFLTGSLGPRRGYATAQVELAELHRIAHNAGATMNDVVLSAATRAFRDLLIAGGQDPATACVRTLVPVSIRRDEERGTADNHVTAMVATLPVAETTALSRLIATRTEIGKLKRSGEPQAGMALMDLAGHVPQGLVNATLTAAFAVPQWFLTTVTTNVPGPSRQLALYGRRILALYPYVPIADRIRVGIAVTSYDGTMYVGITSDLDHIGDPAAIAASMTAELGDLAG